MGKKACYNCFNSEHHQGSPSSFYDPGEPEYYECLEERITEELDDELYDIGEKYYWEDEAYIEMAKVCGYYKPKRVGHCTNCKEKIDSYMHEWDLVVMNDYHGEFEFVCSEKCKKEYNEKMRKYFAKY